MHEVNEMIKTNEVKYELIRKWKSGNLKIRKKVLKKFIKVKI